MATTEYQPGTCNIGPAEIARRRRFAWLGVLGSAALFVGLLVIGAPAVVRLIVVGLAAAGTAVDYLQVRYRFCAGFAARGVYNFGPLGSPARVTDRMARRRDLIRAAQLAAGGALVGLVIGGLAAIVPV